MQFLWVSVMSKPKCDYNFRRCFPVFACVFFTVSRGGGGRPCSLVPSKNWLVFPCSRSFFAFVPYFSNLLALPPPPPQILLDSRRYVAALKSLMLTDRHFLFRYLHLISKSKCFSYPWNQLAKLLVAFSTDSNFKWPRNCCFLLPIKINRRSNTTISWGGSTSVIRGVGPKTRQRQKPPKVMGTCSPGNFENLRPQKCDF